MNEQPTTATIRREVLTDQWLRLNASWPSDGWDGAASARATHHAAVKAVEVQLAAIHAVEGHGPIEDFGVRSQSCICSDRTVEPTSDSRRLDRYGKWIASDTGSYTEGS